MKNKTFNKKVYNIKKGEQYDKSTFGGPFDRQARYGRTACFALLPLRCGGKARKTNSRKARGFRRKPRRVSERNFGSVQGNCRRQNQVFQRLILPNFI